MSSIIQVKSYPEPELNRHEILRYAGGGTGDKAISELMENCITELQGKLSYRVCSCRFKVRCEGDALDIAFATVRSSALKKNLTGCGEIVLFAATVGLELDRLIARYTRVSPARALMLQAIGAERIESLCDIFNAEVSDEARVRGLNTKPRFSPGYGDLPIELQRDIFRVLDCPRKIGLSLNNSLLMSPSKSVTAIIGIGEGAEATASKCSECENKNCSFRSE